MLDKQRTDNLGSTVLTFQSQRVIQMTGYHLCGMYTRRSNLSTCAEDGFQKTYLRTAATDFLNFMMLHQQKTYCWLRNVAIVMNGDLIKSRQLLCH
jgi:hypothetical protein